MTDVSQFEKQLHQKHFEDILSKFNELSEWMSSTFSDVDFSVEFNDDSRNPVQPAFHIKMRLMTGEDMTPNDRLLKKSVITITPAIWDDAMLMTKFIRDIPNLKVSIAREINDWYNTQKLKSV